MAQKLVEAKLKRAWLEGVAARATSQAQGAGEAPTLDAAPGSDTDVASAALADARLKSQNYSATRNGKCTRMDGASDGRETSSGSTSFEAW